MYIWTTKKLAIDLKRRRLDEVEKLKYYIAYVTLLTIAFGLGTLMPVGTDRGVNLPTLIMALIINIGGIIICFNTNKEYDGLDFIERSILFGLPIMIRISVILLVIDILLVLALKKYPDISIYLDSPIFDYAVTVTLVTLYYFFLWKAFKNLPKGDNRVIRQLSGKRFKKDKEQKAEEV
ncbi:MAG: hypothetical protein GXO31_05815 [Epsilonproteobacteria bacterium]|nr:hypothetical protein [Campylobacterota bacterium]